MSYYGTFSRNVEPTAVVAGARAGAIKIGGTGAGVASRLQYITTML